MLDDVKVPLTAVLAAVLWGIGGALVIGGAFRYSALQNVGLGLLIVAAALSVRSALRSGRERERRAFELGRECSEGGDDEGGLRMVRR